jgi:hypothetical protein
MQRRAGALRQTGGQHHGRAAADASGDLQGGFDLPVRQRDDGQVGPGLGQLGQLGGDLALDVQPGDRAGEAASSSDCSSTRPSGVAESGWAGLPAKTTRDRGVNREVRKCLSTGRSACAAGSGMGAAYDAPSV